ncbi:flagellar hook-length control protein FliK [Glaciecola sp. XM2]|uniref:flagellar hook-length control protein FliK n=1 Tax=Glaciecola sp. XM2 TaxID=1914931 RepID=UPI001BDE8AEF|nr:flagellar hook-length control protein FliK [Glaciecola sp. XM2]MBT1450678.1 flagellar hook-length control protein FliK [Glaciecola sp. XM2]
MAQNTIPALKALATLTETASSGQRAIAQDSAAKVTLAKSAVSFTVVASNANQILLQDNANKQKIALATSALQSAVSPKAGDTLVLVSANDQSINFRLLKQSQNQNANVNLPVQLTRTLAQSWPDVGLSALNKAPVSVAAQVQISNTSAGNDNNLIALAKLITQSASSAGKPSIQLPILGTIKAMPVSSQVNANATVSLSLGNGKAIELALPLNAVLRAKIKIGSPVELVLSGNAPSKGIIAAAVQNTPLSKADIAAFNQANSALKQKVTSIIEQSLLSPNKAIKGVGGSQNFTQAVYTMALNKAALNALPESFAQQIKRAIAPNSLDDAQLLINNAKSGRAGNAVSLFAIEKPVMVKINTAGLQANAQSALTQNNNDELSTMLKNERGEARASSSLNNSTSASASAATSASVSTSANSKVQTADALLQAIKLNTSPQKLLELPGKLQTALQHTLSHSAPSAQSIDAVSATLDKVLAQSSIETKQQFTPLLQQLKSLTDYKQNLSNSAAIAATQKSATQGTLQNEGNSEGNSALTEIIKQTMASEAVTQITNPQPQVNRGASNSFIEGLVNLLKLSLAANIASRADAQSPARQTMLQTSLPAFVASIIKPNTAQNTKQQPMKVLQDISRADPKGGLISEIGKLLSTHNTQKLRSAETTLQGNDTYYYAIPNLLNKNGQDIELVVKREQDEQRDNNQDSASQIWKLDIKLDVGKHGKVLAKTKLQNNIVDLHLYASDEALKQRVEKYLPLLHARLTSLGIDINSQRCDIGKVSETLLKTKLNVMHAYA